MGELGGCDGEFRGRREFGGRDKSEGENSSLANFRSLIGRALLMFWWLWDSQLAGIFVKGLYE